MLTITQALGYIVGGILLGSCYERIKSARELAELKQQKERWRTEAYQASLESGRWKYLYEDRSRDNARLQQIMLARHCRSEQNRMN